MGAQHTANKADALICSRCFSMTGSIEQQIAHRLLAGGETGTSLLLTHSCARPQKNVAHESPSIFCQRWHIQSTWVGLTLALSM